MNKRKYRLIFVIPVLNEEDNIKRLLASISKQKLPQKLSNLSVVLVDNGCTDNTIHEALKFNLNIQVINCNIRGIGIARQTGIDYLKNAYSKKDWDEVVIYQIDADCELLDNRSIEKIIETYDEKPNIFCTVGPTIYRFKYEGNNIEINTGKGFRSYFNVSNLEQYFERCNRNINDYLLPSDSYPILIGANTTYRLSIFNNNISFPKDNSWESIAFTIMFYKYYNRDNIEFLESQSIETSSRAMAVNSELNDKTLKTIKKRGYIKPFKNPSTLSPKLTLLKTINQLDKELYQLKDNEYIYKIVPSSELDKYSYFTKVTRTIDHVNALNKKTGKKVLIGSVH